MRAFGAKCQGGHLVFTTPESKLVRNDNGALGSFSPLHRSLESCCAHTFADLSAVEAEHSEKLAYDIHESTGLLKWLGPVFDPNETSEEERQSSSTGSSSREKNAKPNKAVEELVVADMLRTRDAGSALKEVTFPGEKGPRHWIRPFGELLYRGKLPRPGSFGVAYVVSQKNDGSLLHYMQFGQVLETDGRGRYVFWAPRIQDPSRAPVRISLHPSRFAPALIDEKEGMTLPKVTWVFKGGKRTEKKSSKNVTSTKSTIKKEETPSTEEALSDDMIQRLKRAAHTCEDHMDAKELVKEVTAALKSERGKRKILRKGSKLDAASLKEIRDSAEALKQRMYTIRKQVEATREQLKHEDPTCAKDLQEVLVQEEADRCRHDALGQIRQENVALRKAVLHGNEWEARRAIASLIASYGDVLDQERSPSAKKTLREWENHMKRCQVKILAPSERNRALPADLVRAEMEAASGGYGFSKAAEAKLLSDCSQVKSSKIIRGLLRDKKLEHDVHEWEEIKNGLAQEKNSSKTRIHAIRCEKNIDTLLESARTKGCRELLLEALRKTGSRPDRSHNATDLGKHFSLKVAAAQKSKNPESLRSIKEVLKNSKIYDCLDALHLPDLDLREEDEIKAREEGKDSATTDPFSPDEHALLKSCDEIEDVELMLPKVLRGDAAQKKTALQDLLKRLQEVSPPNSTQSCKVAAEKLLAAAG